VADIGGDTGSTLNIVESELGNSWVELEQEGERLTDTASSTEDSDTGVLYHVLAFGALFAFLVFVQEHARVLWRRRRHASGHQRTSDERRT